MKGTEDMPEPQTLNYDQQLKLSQKFVDDVMGILINQPYVEVNDMVKTIMNSNYVLAVGPVNEIIQRVSKYPYQVVKDFMGNIETNQGIYFTAYNPAPAPAAAPTAADTVSEQPATEVDPSAQQ